MEPFGVENCNLKSIEVFDGNTYEDSQLATICNGRKPDPVISSSNYILIRYKNKLQNENHLPAFRAKYTRVCEFRFFGPDSGVFTTPSYPKPYAEQITCTFHIYGPSETNVHANFTDFSIAESKPVDVLDIDGNTQVNLSNQTIMTDLEDESKSYVDVYLSDSNKRRYYKGAPMELISELNKMTIIFHVTTNPIKARGIRVEYSFERIPCGGIYTEAKGGFLTFSHTNECKYIFEAPEGKDVRVSILPVVGSAHMRIYGNTTGGNDYLLKILTDSGPFEDTFHFNVITIFSAHSTYLLRLKYEFVDRKDVCGGNFSTLYGVIKSPNWPESYIADLDCVWIITAPLGNKIELAVQNFSLETTCTGDVLEIRNGMFSNSPLIGRYCGNEIPSRIPSFTNSLYLRFTSDNSVEGFGFHITWEQTESGCGGKLTSFKGSIHPPVTNDDIEDFNSLVTCDWTIHVAQGSSVVINVMPSIDTMTFCRSNRLHIYDGPTASKPILRFNCTDTEKSGRITITSSTNEVLVVYNPTSENSRDFILDYETNCKMVLDHGQGVIESPNFPELYPDLLNCNWDIRAGANNKLKLAFSHLSLEAENMECEYDYVDVLDMKNEDVLQKYHLCTEIPAPITSEGNHLVIKFVTDYATSKSGFRAEYSRVGCGEFLTSEFGSIEPPKYPNSVDVDCDWYIEVPAGKQIVFSVFEIEIDTDTQDCSVDVLLAKESKLANHTLLKECSTQHETSVFTTPFNQLYVNFRSGPSRRRKYFKAGYSTKDASCGGLYRGSSGTINSPNYPQNSSQEHHCKWEIVVPESYDIVLKFNDFQIGESRNCTESYLKFSKLSGQTETLLKQYCGSERPEPVSVSGGRLSIEYMSKGTQSWGRFSIEFKKQCGQFITGGSGFLMSDAGEICLWVFYVTAGTSISLNILQLDCYCSKEDKLQPKGCSHFLGCGENIYDKDHYHNDTVVFCEDHHSNIVFDNSVLHILAREINFRAKYSTTQHSCGGIITSARGSLASPYYPGTYPPNVECNWFIEPSRGNNIQLQIVEMDIAKSDHCNEDYLEISTMNPNKLLGIFCGNEIPDDLIVSYKKVGIRFRSSAGSTGNGFKLNWNYGHINEIGNVTKGTIESPPLTMVRNEENPFAWRILVERKNYISLAFIQYIDGLSLYDGFDDTALPVDIPPPPWRFVSSSNVVFLKTDNDNLQYFQIEWNITNNKVIDTNTTVSECHTELNIKPHSRTVVLSPGYPHGYEPNLQCEWIYKPANIIEHVVCEVYVVQLETTDSCSADYLKISTSTDLTQWHEMRKLCNSSDMTLLPFLVLHGTPHIKLDFISDASVNRTGFVAKLKTKCGSNLTDEVGFIQGESLIYEKDCMWQILVRPTKHIRLQLDFAPTSVGNINECLEYALIYDGMDAHAPLMAPGKICNPQNVSRLLLNSTSNYVTIKYNLTLPRPQLPKRWNLTYREYSECYEEYRLIPEAATINVTSPNYPNIPHPHTECEWRVVAPRGELIQVEFVDRFDMNSRFCSMEYLEAYDGSTSLAKSMGRYCRKPPILKTTQNILYLRYQTDIREPRSGFRARISISKCGGSYNDINGIILSPGYPSPGSYPSSTLCDYVINMPADATMHLVITDINLPFNSGNPKTSDYLEIIPIGDDVTGTKPMFVYGNTTKGSSFDLNVNKAIVRFHTFGKNTEYRGFSLKYNRFGGQCIQDVSGDSGILTMHFPKMVLYSSFCRWTITVPKGQRVRLEFLNLNELKEQNATRYPNFDVYNGHEMLSKLIAFDVNSFDPGAVIQSSDNLMLVRIHIPLVEFQLKTIRARYTSDEISPCPAHIGDDNQSGLIDIQDTHPVFRGNYLCHIKIKLSGQETLVFNITSFELTRNASAPKIHSPLVFRDQMTTTSYWGNLTLAQRTHTQSVGHVRIMQSEYDHIRRLRMDYRRHKCGGYFSVISNLDLEPPGMAFFGNGRIMCVWALAKPFWTGRVDSEFVLSGNFTFSDSCEREFISIQEGQWKDSPQLLKICKDNVAHMHGYTLKNRLTYITYQSQDYNDEKSHISLQLRKSLVCGSEAKVTQVSSSVEIKRELYKNNQECSWVFFTTPGFYLQLMFFDRFFIEDSPNCTKEYLEIQRFEDGLWFPEARFCGRELPSNFNASTPRIRVVWHTNEAVTGDGFSFFVRSHCSVTLNVTSAVQQIISPSGFGYGGRRLQCEYVFQSNETNKLINVRAKSSLAGSFLTTRQCRSAGLIAYKRDENGVEQAGDRHCELEFEERAFKYLRFNYDATLMVQYTIEYVLDTCGGNITTSPTTIRPLKHEQQNLYADNMNCVWFIVAPADHSIAIRFKYFDTEKNFDHVSIYSGTKIQTDKRQAKLSGNLTENPPTILVDHNQAVINAVSDVSSSAKGFEAHIIFVSNCNERISLTDGNSPVILARTFKLSGVGEYLCTHRVTAPKDHRIRIDIKKLLLNNSTSHCVNTDSKCERDCNAMEALDSVATQQATMGRFCAMPLTNLSLMSSYEDAMLKFNIVNWGLYSFEIILNIEKSVCGETRDYKLGESEIFKFSFPKNGETSYAPNVHCTWHFQSDAWMKIHFNYIDLQNTSQVTGKCVDYIEIKGKYSSNQYCGHATNYSTIVERHPDNDVDVTFHSDATVQGRGVEFLIHRGDACNKTHHQLSGTIRYEGSFVEQRPCKHTIVVQENYTLNLYVTNMYFKNFDCKKLHFRITDLKTNKTLLDRCHSSYENIDIFTSTNAVELDAMDYTSITIFYTVSQRTDTPGCGGTLQTSEGYLSNPSYDNDRNFSECRWDIIVPAPNTILINFYAFNMGASTNCPLDNVQLIDILPDGTEKMIKTLCGSELQNNILTSSSNHLALISKKSPNYDGTGWNLYYRMENIYTMTTT